MYAKFYGLATPPFQLTPDARFFFESTVHRQAMAYLVYGLHHAEGFIIITGEVGAGKTILVDNLLSTIDQSNFIIAKIVTTQLAGDDLLHLVAGGFGIAKEGLAKGSLLQRINDFVLAQQRNGRRVLLIVDEAQNLSFEALEELRMLSNIVVDKTMALQSFLLGQPQFRAILGSPRLEQLRQRVTAAYHLGPLSEAETRAYVEHRLRRADWKGDPRIHRGLLPADLPAYRRRAAADQYLVLEVAALRLSRGASHACRPTRSKRSPTTCARNSPSSRPSRSRGSSRREPNGKSDAASQIAERLSILEEQRRSAWARHQARDRNRGQLFPERPAVNAPTEALRQLSLTNGCGSRGRTAPVEEACRQRMRGGVANAMTIDVEDYFQVEAFASTIDRSEWESLPRRVERNTERLLDILAESGVEATFFILGWVAERHPALVRRIVAEGHELASHGSDHRAGRSPIARRVSRRCAPQQAASRGHRRRAGPRLSRADLLDRPQQQMGSLDPGGRGLSSTAPASTR